MSMFTQCQCTLLKTRSRNPDIFVVTVVLRIDLDPYGPIGPGKIRLLKLIDEAGSISAAGRKLDMSYRRAWILVEELNRCFRESVVTYRS